MNSNTCILIVDDDADDREILRDAFTSVSNKYEFKFLENGDQLLQYLDSEGSTNGCLILLDLNMPGKDGRETLRELKMRSDWAILPTIVMTTSSSQRDKQISYELGANLFLTKPDTFNRLVETARAISYLWMP